MPHSHREISYDAPADEAFSDVLQAAMDAGTPLDFSEKTRTLTVRIRCGLQWPKLRVSVLPAGKTASTIQINASGDDLWGIAARRGTDKLIRALG